MTDDVTVLGTGDLVLGIPGAAELFDATAPLLRAGDVTIGHVEVPHTDAPDLEGRPGLPPDRLDVLAEVGFDVATLAGNHVYDHGRQGIVDTATKLRSLGLAVTGAGSDLAEAREPAIVERRGRRIGVLSLNTVGPDTSWANDAKAGCAYVRVITAYELDYASPGGKPRVFTMAEPDSLAAMQRDVRDLVERVDVAVVALHKGLVHEPRTLAAYERQVAHAAIDAGAHVVLSHHGHVTQGIEVYRDRPIFHGLGNFVTVTNVLSTKHVAGEDSWAARRLEIFGFRPDPAMPDHYAFHPESRHGMLAHCRIDRDGRVEAGYIPCWIDEHARPVPLREGETAERVVDYVKRAGDEAGLSTSYRWAEGVVRVT